MLTFVRTVKDYEYIDVFLTKEQCLELIEKLKYKI